MIRGESQAAVENSLAWLGLVWQINSIWVTLVWLVSKIKSFTCVKYIKEEFPMWNSYLIIWMKHHLNILVKY